MKVRAYWEQVVECESDIDVDVNTVLSEFHDRIENEPCKTSLWLSAIDFCTKLMAKVTDEGIAACKQSARDEVVKRLTAEVERWSKQEAN